MTIRPGDDWGTPTSGAPACVIAGDDHALAAAAAELDPDTLLAFAPDPSSDLARAIGLEPGATTPRRGIALPVDAILVERSSALLWAVNAVELGTPPGSLRATSREAEVSVTVDGRRFHEGPATTVVIANGQFIDGLDVSPRGHPGDGRVEVQVYALRPGERSGMRRRLPTGVHLPHPRIRTGSGRRIRVRVRGGTWPVRIDGRPTGRSGTVGVEVHSPAFHLVV
jgi:hypothetical protein